MLLPTTVQDLDILEAACGTIQSAMRQRLARELPTPKQTKRSRLWAHGGSLPQPYIDIGSGASALGEMHSNENLVAHEAFRSHLVESALATAWRACAQGASTLVREAYYTMARKLYLSVTLHCGEEPDPYECLRRLEGEWTYYAGAKELLTQNEFARAWLRLAGMHATTVSAEVYAEWILSKVHTIAQQRIGEAGGRDYYSRITNLVVLQLPATEMSGIGMLLNHTDYLITTTSCILLVLCFSLLTNKTSTTLLLHLQR